MEGRQHSIQPGATIGRADCDIVLPDPDVSRKHATIRQIDGGLAVEDLGSTNGTYVDGERVTGITELRAGATLRFGNTVWRLQAPPDATRIVDSMPSSEPAATRAGAQQVTPPPPDPAIPAPAEEPTGTARAPSAQPPSPASPALSPDGRRGDVPAPDSIPSVIRPVLPPPGEPPPFSAASAPRVRRSPAGSQRPSLATRSSSPPPSR